jgi:hypothetical protein
MVFGITLFCLRRSHRRRVTNPIPSPPSYELSIEHARLEAAANASRREPEKPLTVRLPVRTELWGHEAAAEMGRNSTYVPPVELPGDAIFGEDKKGVNRLVKIHTVR